MSKVKSTVITVLLVLAIVVAAFFATISFPVGEIYRINSISSGIHLGADLSGYAYTTIYPKGVITAEDFSGLSEEDAEHYELIGGLYVDRVEYDDAELEELKADVQSDAEILADRYGRKGYSSYSVSVEDGLSIRICVPTNFTYASYKGNDSTSRSTDLSAATAALTTICADGKITLRTTDASIELTDASGNSTTYSPRKDDLYETALVDGAHTYSIAGTDDVSEYFESVSTMTFGNTTAVTLNFTEEGQESFAEVTTRAASSDSQTIYFFVGDTQVLSFNCTSTVSQRSLSLQASDKGSGENSAITLQSVVEGNVLGVEFPLWTELVPTAKQADKKLFPRLIVCAEAAWRGAPEKDAVSRAEKYYPLLKRLGAKPGKPLCVKRGLSFIADRLWWERRRLYWGVLGNLVGDLKARHAAKRRLRQPDSHIM